MRMIVLCAASVLVLAIGVHLFMAVHADPVPVTVPVHATSARAAAAAEPRFEDAPAPTPPPAPTLAPHLEAPGGEGRPLGLHPGGRFGTLGRGMPHPAVVDDDGSVHEVAAEREKPASPVDEKLEAEMVEANKAYDRGDTDEAKDIAKRIVDAQPANVRMLRILVSTSCIDGDAATAKQYYTTLPKNDQNQMATRCARYGVTFDGSGQ